MATGTQRFDDIKPGKKTDKGKTQRKTQGDSVKEKYTKGTIGQTKTKAAKTAQESKKSRCPYFKKCGACQMIDTPYDKQLRQKHAHVAELLEPYTKVAAFVGMDEPEHYRCKVHAVFTHDKKHCTFPLICLILLKGITLTPSYICL